jgi:hypothetical protein
MGEVSSLVGLVSVAIRTRVRLDRLILLIPCWEGREPIPKRSEGPRMTSNPGEAESSNALDLNAPNREEPLFGEKTGSRFRGH